MAESVASTKTGKNGERRNPTDNYLGRLGSFEDIFQTLDLIIFAVWNVKKSFPLRRPRFRARWPRMIKWGKESKSKSHVAAHWKPSHIQLFTFSQTVQDFCQEKNPYTNTESLAQKITWTTLTAWPRTTLSRVTSPASGLKSYIA